MTGRRKTWIRIGAAAFAVALWPGLAVAARETPIPLENPRVAAARQPADQVEAKFTVYVGGFLFAQGELAATLAGTSYDVRTELATAGLPRAFYQAVFKLASEGTLADARVRPRRYFSDSREWDHPNRLLTLTYSGDGAPSMTTVPPPSPGDKSEVPVSEQIDAQDPVSAVIVPVPGGANPCMRSIPVYDGRRRYDLELSYDSEKKMMPRGLQAPVTAIVCNIRYVPVAPVEQRKFTEMLRKNDGMKIWLAPFDGGRIYMPVRFQLRTPLGAAVMELTEVSERMMTADGR